MLSKLKRGVLVAYEKGYRAINGQVISPIKNRVLKLEKKCTCKNSNYFYYKFVVFSKELGKLNVKVHQLVAYQKYGDKLFDEGIVVRHIDGNSLNNIEDNIAIGTVQDNRQDIPKELRLKYSIYAATKNRKFSDVVLEDIRKLKKEGKSYSQIMKIYKISSKGTLHYILTNKYKTKK